MGTYISLISVLLPGAPAFHFAIFRHKFNPISVHLNAKNAKHTSTYQKSLPFRTAVTTTQALPQAPRGSQWLAFFIHMLATMQGKYGRVVLHVRAEVNKW